MLGLGFREQSLERGLSLGVDFIGADSGSTDGGPAALAGAPPRLGYERDLSLLLRGARRAGVPLQIGSSATSGRDWGVDHLAAITRKVAKEHKLPTFKLARIYSELSTEYVLERLRMGRVKPIEPAPRYDEEVVLRSTRIVAVMGIEPFQSAISGGADVVLGGRATDAAIFASQLISHGVAPGVAWHAGKIAECGSAAAEPRRPLDLLYMRAEKDTFEVHPLSDDVRCTRFSVASKQLHEVSDPFTFVEPGWTTDLSKAVYEPISDRAVRVSGATAVKTTPTVLIEGVESAGYQRFFFFSVNDPTILESLDAWLSSVDKDVAMRCYEELGEDALEQCEINTRVYGRDGTMGPWEPHPVFEGHEAFFLIDVVAPTEQICRVVTNSLQYALYHAKSPGWRGHGTVAAPFTRAIHDNGEVYRFNAHHVIEVDDPLEVVRIEYEEV
jgi:hypothetical protein